jgi:hypothetical protein
VQGVIATQSCVAKNAFATWGRQFIAPLGVDRVEPTFGFATAARNFRDHREPAALASHRPWPDRGAQKVHPFDRWVASLTAVAIAKANWQRGRSAMMIVPAIDSHGKQLSSLDDRTLRARADALRVMLRRKSLDPNDVAKGFALVREAATRTIGQRYDPVQLAGGWALMQGMVAEMQPGEGKTLTATLAASVAAMTGAPVHVVTVNDYLARRDAEAMGPIYRFLGLSVGMVLSSRQRNGGKPTPPTLSTSPTKSWSSIICATRSQADTALACARPCAIF